MNKTSQIFAYVCTILMCLTVLLSLCACNQDTQTDSLVVYNWADYIYPDYEQDFKDYYKSVTGRDIEITYVTFDTPETMITKLTQSDSKIDIMCPSEYAIQKLLNDGYLDPLNYFDESKYLDATKLNGYEHYSANVDSHIIDKIVDGFSDQPVKGQDGTVDMIDYMVPYMYGTLGILYNRAEFRRLGIDAEKMNKANWGILFNDSGDRDAEGNVVELHSELNGNILMKDSIRDTYAATLFYLVESGALDGLTTDDGRAYASLSGAELINTIDDTTLEKCKDALTAQKSQLFGYEVDFGKDDLLKGNAMVDLAWSGDAMYAVEESWHLHKWVDGKCTQCYVSKADVTNDEGETEEGDYILAYYLPHTYGNIWFDGWVRPIAEKRNVANDEAAKLFINFLNTPYVAAGNMNEIGYSSALSPDAVKNAPDARALLADAYAVNIDGATEGDFDYDSWEEFAVEFFDKVDYVDNSNWRYPFVSAIANEGSCNRGMETLGMMRDFGDKNAQVVTMWNYARSVGVSALPVMLWLLLGIAAVVGLIFLFAYVDKRRRMKVVL